MGASRETLQVTGLWLVWVSYVGDRRGSSPILKIVPLPTKMAKRNRDKMGSERRHFQGVRILEK